MPTFPKITHYIAVTGKQFTFMMIKGTPSSLTPKQQREILSSRQPVTYTYLHYPPLIFVDNIQWKMIALYTLPNQLYGEVINVNIHITISAKCKQLLFSHKRIYM